MERERNIKIIILASLIISVVAIFVAFAAMSTTLNINGTAELKTESWEIKFQNLTLQTPVGDAIFTTNPVIQSDTIIGNYEARLTKPGDGVSFTFDIKNNGTIDAKLGQILINGSSSGQPVCTGKVPLTASSDETIVCGNLAYTITYTSGGNPLAVNDTLTAGSSKTVKVQLIYNGSQMPANDVDITGLGIKLVYNQD